MKKAVAALCCLVVVFPVISTVAEEPKPTEVESRITAVTVYSDRSRVTRIGNVSLRSGNLEYAFAGLPGWLDESSVRLSLSDPAAGRITDVRIQRKYLVRAGSKDIRNAEDASQEILDKVAELDAELRVLMAKEKQIAGIRAFAMDRLPSEAAVRDIKIEEYAKVVQYVTDSHYVNWNCIQGILAKLLLQEKSTVCKKRVPRIHCFARIHAGQYLLRPINSFRIGQPDGDMKVFIDVSDC